MVRAEYSFFSQWQRIAMLVLLLVGIASVAWSQDPAPADATGPGPDSQAAGTAPADASAKPKADPLPASKILEGVQKAQARIQELAQATTEAGVTVEVQRVLPDFEKDLQTHAGEAMVLLEGGVIPDRLVDIEISWSKRRDKLSAWSDALSERIQELSGYVDEFATEKLRWEKAQADGEKQGLADSVLGRIRSLRSNLDELDERARKRQNVVLTLQDQLVTDLGITSAVLKEVDKVRTAQREKLFALDSPPLWGAIARFRKGETTREDPAIPLASALQVSSGFFESHVGQTVGFVCFVLVVALLVSGFGSAAHRWVAAEPGSEGLTNALSRPISGGVLVGLLVFPWVYPERPMIVAGLASLLLVIPMIRLLTPLVSDSVRKVIYAVSIWVVVDLLRDYLIAEPVLNRLVLLAETVVVLVGIAWLIRPARLSEVERPGIGMRFLGVGARIAGLILLVSIGANVVGNVTLAQLLCVGLLNSIYFGIVLYGALQVLEGLYYVILRTPAANHLRMVQHHSGLLRRRGMRVLGIAMAFFWLMIALRQFDMRGVAFEWASEVLGAKLGAGGLEFSLGQVLGFFFTLWVSVLLARLIRFVLQEDVLPRTQLARGVPHTISQLVSYAVIVMGFVLAVAVAGLDMGRFVLMISALGVGIGIGLQDVVNNFVSGLILLFERPIQVGDTVELAECHGVVKSIGLRSTTVRTWDGAEVVIPNSRFIANEFTNWTLSDPQRRMQIPVGVAYGTDPARVLELLQSVAASNPEVMEDPEPAALFTGFGESSLDFMVRAWTESLSWRQVMSDLTIAIHQALADADITVPFPQRDLHLVSVAEGVSPPGGGGERGGPASDA